MVLSYEVDTGLRGTIVELYYNNHKLYLFEMLLRLTHLTDR